MKEKTDIKQIIIILRFALQDGVRESEEPLLGRRGLEKSNHRKLNILGGFPDGSVVKNLPTNAGDRDPILSLRRSHKPQSS